MKEFWCEAFGLDEKDYQILKNATPNGMSTLHYGFQSKKLDFEIYKKWIQKKVNIPFLKDSVFTEKRTLAEMQLYCKKYQMLLIEGQESLIFYSYGHIKYVACFYPKALPDTPKTDVHYVLVSPESLAKLRELARMKPIVPEEQLKAIKARMNATPKKPKSQAVSVKAPPKVPPKHLSQPNLKIVGGAKKVAPKVTPPKAVQSSGVKKSVKPVMTNTAKKSKPVTAPVKQKAKASSTKPITPTRPTRNISSQPAPNSQKLKINSTQKTNSPNKKKLG